jgi:hypothetical protein
MIRSIHVDHAGKQSKSERKTAVNGTTIVMYSRRIA